MLELQKYLQINSLSSLTEKYKIQIKQDLEFPELHLFKYNQIESPMGEKIVQESRGIILNSSNNWKIVSRAFDKFFNYGEYYCAEIDLNNFYIQEKLDGSLMTLYFYKGNWRVASSGNPSAQGDIYSNQNSKSEISDYKTIKFYNYFWSTFNSQGLKLPNFPNCELFSFIFELTGPLNRVVVIHDKPSLTLLSVRNLETQEEYLPCEANDIFNLQYPFVEYHNYKSLEELKKSFETKSPLSHEGCVVLSKNKNISKGFDRAKIKHPGYVTIHHARDGFNEKSCLDIIRNGEISEVVNAYPEFEKMLEQVKLRYENMLSYVDNEYSKFKNILDQKEFALTLKKNNVKCMDVMFCLRNGKTLNTKQFYKNYNLDNLMKIIETF